MSLTKTLRKACPIFVALLCSAAWCQPAPAVPPAASMAEPGAERKPFEDLHRTIERSFPDVGSVVVLQRGELLFEHYQAGRDADSLHAVQSVTKSVLALLVGIALDRGALTSLDQPIATLLPAAVPQEPAAYPPTTIRHLLTMTSGFEAPREFRSADADDPQFLLRRARTAAPGSVFRYDNLASNLLAIVLEAATGQPVAAFARQHLFEPLGIAGFDWETGRHGHALGFSGLYLRTLDMARLGQLVLQQGAWQGRQLVSKAFVAAAVQPQNAGGNPVGQAYGYLWWVSPAGHSRPTFFASGYGGQLIWVYPSLDLVVATTSVVSEASNSRGQALTLIRNDILPLLTSGGAPGR